MVNEALEWWGDTLADLRKAEDMFNLGWYDDACFHAQQAVEKALKAALAAGGRILRTHDLSELMECAEQLGLSVNGIRAEDIETLSNQYLAPRYPNFKRDVREARHSL